MIKGNRPGQIVELNSERMVLGRHPDCEIVIENAAVSRRHAQILESHGSYFLEDLRSRNRTYLNGSTIEGRTQLNEADTIKVCDVLFRFHQRTPQPIDDAGLEFGSNVVQPVSSAVSARETLPEGFQTLGVGDEAEGLVDDKSSVITTLNTLTGTTLRLGVKPEIKLRAVLEIGRALSNVLEIDGILQKTLDGLFQIFPQVDQGFALLKDAERKKLVVKATKLRDERKEATVRISTTIVQQAMEHCDAILSADAVEDDRFQMSDSLSSLQIKSMMCVPLHDSEGRALGVVQLDTQDMEHQFNEEDLDLFCNVVSQVSLAVVNANLHTSLLEQREMQRDLELATHIQLGFLPNDRPHIEGYRFADYYEAAQRVGGDYFDYVTLPDERLAIALGDVAGKGVPAALLMARIYSSARFHLLTQPTAAAAMTELNTEIVSSGLGHRFVTFVIVILDPRAHQITLSNAGHLPPLLRNRDGETLEVGPKKSGMPLGVSMDQHFDEQTTDLAAGDTIVLYTDGITEAMNSDRQIYGRKRLSKFLAEGSSDIEELPKGLIADVESFSEGQPQRDDMCFVCLQRSG
jgi:serine phosphatase RsbU (regulator of sigma subunit)